LQRYQQRLQAEPRPAAARKTAMDGVNPLYVPRNYLAQMAIDAATEGDAGRLEEWMEVLKHPYTEQPGKAQYAGKRPEWARHRAGCSMLSCSS
jgi:serine/tyrosine/threonine adenylyltransferase